MSLSAAAGDARRVDGVLVVVALTTGNQIEGDAVTSRIVVLAGGVGGSKFVRGTRETLRRRGVSDTASVLSVVVNTGDDLWLSGVRLQPDIDSILYALAGVGDVERGWGRAGESERVSAELKEWGAGWPWFTLGDLDLGTHLARTGWLREGLTVSQVAERLCARWPIGARLLPMTDAEVDTMVTVRFEALGDSDGSVASGTHTMHFQEWWTRFRASLEAVRFDNPGVESAVPGAGVTEAIASADVVVLAPSNPVVSIGPIVSVPGIRAALAATSAPVIGVSPIIGGHVVRGMADACLQAIGVETSAAAVAAHYGSRAAGGLLDAWLLAEEDDDLAGEVKAAGVHPLVCPLWMRDLGTEAALADRVLALAAELRAQ